MNDNSLAMEHYLKAKSDLKKDVKICVFFSVPFSIIIAFLVSIFENVFFAIYLGIVLACAPIGLTVVFKFAFKLFSNITFISLFILLVSFVVLLAISISYGPIIAIVKFIIGYSNVKKLGKLLGQ